MKVFNETFSLALSKNDRLWKGDHVPVWTLDDDGKEIINETDLRFERVADGEHIGHAYQDEDNMAAVLLYRDSKGRLLVDGSIGEDLVIRPIPARVLKDVVSKMDHLQSTRLVPKVSRDRRSVDYEMTEHHVVYKRSASHEDEMFSDFAYMEPDRLNKRYRRKRSIDDLDARVKRSLESHTREKREAPYVIYPEILCIVDYDGYRMHGGDNPNVKRYFVSFWNGVDLRYKLLKGPKIRISIAGIIISRAKNATPYLERNRVGRDAIDSAAALTDMGKYLYRERRLPVYDIAVAVTKLDMCRRQYANEVCNRGTAGFAYVGGACVVNKRLEKVNSVAIIEDTGGFSGIIVAAHEVGHLLGAVHDGSPPPSYLGGPGAQKCRWEDGYIMSDLRHTEKGFRWSSCSVQSFHHFLNSIVITLPARLQIILHKMSKNKEFIFAFVALLAVASALPQLHKRGAPAQEVQLVKELASNNDGLGKYQFAYELSDGQRREESADVQVVREARSGEETVLLRQTGSFSYVSPDDGKTYTVKYVADENGFQPIGEHIPKFEASLKLLPTFFYDFIMFFLTDVVCIDLRPFKRRRKICYHLQLKSLKKFKFHTLYVVNLRELILFHDPRGRSLASKMLKLKKKHPASRCELSLDGVSCSFLNAPEKEFERCGKTDSIMDENLYYDVKSFVDEHLSHQQPPTQQLTTSAAATALIPSFSTGTSTAATAFTPLLAATPLTTRSAFRSRLTVTAMFPSLTTGTSTAATAFIALFAAAISTAGTAFWKDFRGK
ncbi:unnamed protein product [Trichogramma brassicae]|uniref:Peptidase M12B domain-containing protein n=1 Tax=Trichogramma brassicae TaxID=86971 RepID=A0A6H5IYK9_9HYME|nr:unnamed protein product [Trichogramma brassicae]